MKKCIPIIVVIMIAIFGISLTFLPKTKKQEPDLSQVRAICNLATLKTYYHNVAKVDKAKEWIFQKDRELWIEYTGTATIGIDMSKVEMKVGGEKIEVFLPKAQLLSIDIEEGKIDDNSYFYSKDNVVFKNKITPEEETEAINVAQNNMRNSVENNTQLLKMSQDRSKDLIERYINQLGKLSNVSYNIEWKYEE